jgi:hypothetical protein
MIFRGARTGSGGVQEVRDSADAAISKIEDYISNYIPQVPQDPITTNVKQDVAKVLATNPRGQQFVCLARAWQVAI